MTRASNKGVVAGRVLVANTSTSAPQASPLGHAVRVIGVSEEGRAREPAQVVDAVRSSPKSLPKGFPKGFDEKQPRGASASDDQAAERAPEQPEARTDARDIAERRLERRIRAHMSKGELAVTLTDNRYTMISVRREGRGVKHFKVRLHHMFAEAGPMVTRALARYVTYNDREASRILGDFIDANQHRVRGCSKRMVSPRLKTSGKVYDLQDIFDEMNARYFANSIDARITWGQKTGKPKRRNSIKMGSYSVEDKLIRIHQSLDRSFVPRFFVEWVVYHEMLHQVHDIKVVNGRRQFHSKEFLRDEAKFARYVEARLWERAHLDALLTY